MDFTGRTEMLLGQEQIQRLARKHVAVFGLGGVGGSAAEALARSGIGQMTIVDDDTVSVSNINRQVIALHSVVGMPKTEVAAQRLSDINPDLVLHAVNCFFSSQTAGQFDFSAFDYVVDAIDTVTSKLLLAELCTAAGTPLIASMGTGNKLDPTRLTVTDIYRTHTCPLARVMRTELRKRGIPCLKVVYSEEPPLTPAACNEDTGRRATPGSTAFVPPVAGMIAAAQVIKDLIAGEEIKQ